MPLKTLVKPLNQWIITQKFGINPNIYKRFGLKGHNGIDLRTRSILSPLGKIPVFSAQAGVVERVDWSQTGYGFSIRIRHPDGSLTIYGHLSKILVTKKEIVGIRQQIGITGSTGFSSGPHLHFEFRPSGWEKLIGNGFAGAVDPIPYIKD